LDDDQVSTSFVQTNWDLFMKAWRRVSRTQIVYAVAPNAGAW
jgi:hypothetical protein